MSPPFTCDPPPAASHPLTLSYTHNRIHVHAHTALTSLCAMYFFFSLCIPPLPQLSIRSCSCSYPLLGRLSTALSLPRSELAPRISHIGQSSPSGHVTVAFACCVCLYLRTARLTFKTGFWMLIHDVLLEILFINGHLVCASARDSLTCELPTYFGAADCRVAMQAAGCVSGAFACYVNATPASPPSSSRLPSGASPRALVLTNHGMYCDIHSHFISAGHLPPAHSADMERNVNVEDDCVSREAAIESLLSYISRHISYSVIYAAHKLLHTDIHLRDRLFYSLSHIRRFGCDGVFGCGDEGICAVITGAAMSMMLIISMAQFVLTICNRKQEMESSFFRVLCNRHRLQQLQQHHQQQQPFHLLSHLYLWTITMKSQSHTFHEATSVLTTLPCISHTLKAQHPARACYHYHAAAVPASTTAASPG
jgi:hypothetical protein